MRGITEYSTWAPDQRVCSKTGCTWCRLCDGDPYLAVQFPYYIPLWRRVKHPVRGVRVHPVTTVYLQNLGSVRAHGIGGPLPCWLQHQSCQEVKGRSLTFRRGVFQTGPPNLRSRRMLMAGWSLPEATVPAAPPVSKKTTAICPLVESTMILTISSDHGVLGDVMGGLSREL